MDNDIELTDEQLEQVIGGCGGHDLRVDNCSNSQEYERRHRQGYYQQQPHHHGCSQTHHSFNGGYYHSSGSC